MAEQAVLERAGLVTMKGKPIILLGPEIKVGEAAPDFRVIDGSFQPVRLTDFKGKVLLLAAVPSLDTGVCATETKRFNDEARKLPANVVVLTISDDLPFAQKRFCDSEKVNTLRVLSDCVSHDFGLKYGVQIKDMGLLSRSIFVIDKSGRISYKEIVPENGTLPNFDAALAAARKAAGE